MRTATVHVLVIVCLISMTMPLFSCSGKDGPEMMNFYWNPDDPPDRTGEAFGVVSTDAWRCEVRLLCITNYTMFFDLFAVSDGAVAPSHLDCTVWLTYKPTGRLLGRAEARIPIKKHGERLVGLWEKVYPNDVFYDREKYGIEGDFPERLEYQLRIEITLDGKRLRLEDEFGFWRDAY